MQRSLLKVLYLPLAVLIIACSGENQRDARQHKIVKRDTLYIQVVGAFDEDLLTDTQTQLAKHFKNLKTTRKNQFPSSAYYSPRKRYIADTIISQLAKTTSPSGVSMALTQQDISTKKGNIQNYGIMGLGYSPGKACVVSTFRLKKENLQQQFYKLCLHELGHTAGLPHCQKTTCFMRDAEGKNHFDEESGFCEFCKTYLNERGWNLQ